MKAILHCGTFKTGSTTIQNTAYYNQSALRKSNIIYPSTGIDLRAEKDNGEIGFRHSRFAYEYGSSNYSQLLKQLGKEIDKANCSTLFISAEPWSNPRTAYSLNSMVEHLKKVGFTEIRGIVFIRNIHDYMVRHYREWVRRHGASQNFSEYIIAQKFFFDYLTICKNITKALQGNVDFFNFDKISDINEFTFSQLDVDYHSLKLPPRANEGLSCIDVEIIRILNQYGLKVNDLPDSASLLSHFGLCTHENVFLKSSLLGLWIYSIRNIFESFHLSLAFRNQKARGYLKAEKSQALIS